MVDVDKEPQDSSFAVAGLWIGAGGKRGTDSSQGAHWGIQGFTLPSPFFQPPSAKYGGRHTVTMIPGDGIGPELMLHVKSVFRYGGSGPCLLSQGRLYPRPSWKPPRIL